MHICICIKNRYKDILYSNRASVDWRTALSLFGYFAEVRTNRRYDHTALGQFASQLVVKTMSEKIPKTYISSVAAARDFKKTNDYVALLCRRQAVQGKLVDGVWYVDPTSLSSYLEQKATEREARRLELSKSLSSEYRENVREQQTALQNIFLRAKEVSVGAPIGLVAGAILLLGSLVFASTLVPNTNPPAGGPSFAAVSAAETPFFGTTAPAVTGTSNFLSGIFATLFGHTSKVADVPPQNNSSEKSSDLLPSVGQTSPQKQFCFGTNGSRCDSTAYHRK